MSKLQFDDFILKRLTFEFRYDPAYLLWDSAGQIWNQAKEQWPDIVNKSAEPNKTYFTVKDKLELTVELEKSYVIAFKPDFKELVSDLDYFLNLVRRTLDVSSYNRLGARFIYEKKFDDKDSACEAFLTTNMINFPDGKHFGIEGKIASPQCVFQWENENIGVRSLLQVASRKLAIDVPPTVEEIEPIEMTNDIVILDIDYFTKVPTNPGQFSVTDWINQVHHLVKRDSHIFLGQ